MPVRVTSLAERLTTLGYTLVTAESCTGGLISSWCTDLAGSSTWFDRGFVTYSNEAKVQMLGVPGELITAFGAVSAPVACAMALGAVYRSNARVSLAVTGVAGPGGGTIEKPVGTVWMAWCVNGHVSSELQVFKGDRHKIREATAVFALQGLLKRLTIG